MQATTDQAPVKIMLVDDNDIELYINSRMIMKNAINYKIIQFNKSTQAMAYLIQNKDEAENIPDVLFLDIHMPQMTGFQFLEEYDKLPEMLKSKCSVYMTSSTCDANDLQRISGNPNIKKFFEKPLKKENVEEVINIPFMKSVNGLGVV